MATLETLTANLEHAALTYEASEETYEALRRKTIIPLLGPFAVGKTTVMDSACALDPDFSRVHSFTTRERRTGEDADTYHFLPHTEQSLEAILARVAARDLVQFMVHSTTKNVYGSSLADYGPTPFTMLDVIPKALPALDALPFQDMKKVEVVVPPAEWLGRMDHRLRSGDPADIRNRLQEGIHNLEWAFDQGSGVAWLNNGGRPVEESAVDLIAIARGENTPDVSARRIGDDLWKALKELRDETTQT